MAQGFGLYIHWPFCVSKCPYCDFNSHIQSGIDSQVWQSAYLTELARLADTLGPRPLQTIYFGGGTPSLMPPSLVAALIDTACQYWPAAPDLEITLEANPNSVEISKLAGFKAAGVNRISLGIQALDDEALHFLKRAHSRTEAIVAIEAAASTFSRYSFDLIYARPHQTVQAWESELAFALSLAQDHLSLYQLTIEPNTPFYTQFHRGDFTLPDEDLGTDLYLATQAQLASYDMFSYEISNFSKRGSESRHNLIYWNYEDYAGVGPGAHGRLILDGHKCATRQFRAPQTWLDKVRAGSGTQELTPIPLSDQIREALMMGLRLESGIERARFEEKFGVMPESLFVPLGLSALMDEGLMTCTPTHLRCTMTGRLRLNGVLTHLFRHMAENPAS